MELDALRAALADESIKPPRVMYIIVREGFCVYYGAEMWTNDEDEAKRFNGAGELPDEIDNGAAYLSYYYNPNGDRDVEIYVYMENQETSRCKTSEEKVYAKAIPIETNIY